MVMEKQKFTGPVRDDSPCKGCTEKFTACHDHCPKDLRGEYGYKAFKKRIADVKEVKKAYLKKKYLR